jgi:hypothetical protein
LFQPLNAIEGYTKPGLRLFPMYKQSRVTTHGERLTVSLYGVSGTSWAMAHIQALSSRAMATTTWFGFFPRALSCR